jgi:hypothetical protein
MELLFFLSVILLLNFAIKETRTHSVINPVLIFFVWDLLFLSLIPYWYLVLNGMVSDLVCEKLMAIYTIVSLGFIFGYYDSIFDRFLRISLRNFVNFRRLHGVEKFKIKRISGLFLVAVSFLMFTLLAFGGGGGGLWLSNPREAYISYRAGVGGAWVMYQWAILILQAGLLLSLSGNKIRKILILSLLFIVLAYFTGSKGNILSVIVLSVAYWNFNVRKFGVFDMLILSILMLTVFGFLLALQSVGFNDLAESMASYFSEYTMTVVQYLNEEFLPVGFGKYALSSLWFYLPRSIFEDKPYEYGVLLIHQVLFPNMAETGNTPGIPNWVLPYLDFKLFGVFVFFYISGLLRRVIFDTYLLQRSNLALFLLMVHVCVFQVFALVTPLFLIIIALLSGLIMKQTRSVDIKYL